MLRRKNIVLTLVLSFIMASLCLAGLNTYAAEITMGTNAVLPQSDYNTGNYLMSLKCTLSQPAFLSSLSVNIKANPNGKKLSMALYGDVSGSPGQKLAETAPFVPGTGWNTRAVISPVALPAGNYWIAWYGEDSTLTYAYEPSGGTLCYNDEQTFGVFPGTFPDVASLPYNYSLYATLTAASQNVQTLEAESGSLSGGASVMSNTSASGGQSVGNLHSNNASVTLTGVDGGTGGTATVSLTFSSNDTGASKGLFVNGTKVQTLNFTNTGDWNSFTALTVSVNLNAGLTNTIMIKNDQANGWGVNIDKLVISPQGGVSTPTPTPTPTPTATPTPTPTATPVPDPDKLTYAPPELDADFVTFYVTGSGTFEVNPGGKDARIIMPSSVYTGQIYITNAKNVVMIGGAIQMRHGQYDDRTIYIDRDCTGIIHIEGIHITAGEGCEGDGIAIRAPEATVRIQNCRFDNLVGSNLPGRTHSDVCQPWGGVLELFADRITASSDYQGFYLQLANGPIGSVALKNVNIIGQSRNNSDDTSGGYYLWTDENGANGDSFYPLTVENFWISPRPGDNLGRAVMPEINRNEDLSQVAWNTLNRVGTVYKGIPPEGDFVPLGTAGINYVSPGYNN